jgi:hypothetical protein
MSARFLLLLLAGSIAGVRTAAGQGAADSVGIWTGIIQSGALPQRIDAMSSLANLPPARLTPATRAAIIGELQRISDAIMSGRPIPDASSVGEAVGEYWITLASVVASFRSPEADRALVHSLPISAGIKRRVAGLGDEVVPELAAMIARNYQPAAALRTMALAWFWADSTGASLSDSSRATILHSLLGADTGNARLRSGIAGALLDIGDPAFLALATPLADRALARRDFSVDVVYLQQRAVPRLRSFADRLSPPELVSRTRRVLTLLCRGNPNRQESCNALQHQLDQVTEHLGARRQAEARAALQVMIARADSDLSAGLLTDLEHALIAGGARQVLTRVR